MNWLSKKFNAYIDRVNPRIVEANKVKIHKPGEKTKVLEVKWSDGTTSQYKGSGTVWRTYPMMERCSSMDRQLTDINQYIKVHGNPYPTAHEK